MAGPACECCGAPATVRARLAVRVRAQPSGFLAWEAGEMVHHFCAACAPPCDAWRPDGTLWPVCVAAPVRD